MVLALLWTEPSCRVDPYLNPIVNFSYFDLNPAQVLFLKEDWKVSTNAVLLISTDSHPALFALDMFCVVFFVLETILHFSSCPWKYKYLKEINNIIRVILCVTMVISIATDMNKQVLEDETRLKFFILVRSISVTRLWLIFRLRKLYNGLDIMLLSLEQSLRELALLLFAFTACVFVYGTMIFCAEIETDNFSNVWNAMWWALVTMTTVGYGDFYPTTTTGYVIGSIAAINGLVILALPVAAIASNFATFYSINGDFNKHRDAIKTQTSSYSESETLRSKPQNDSSRFEESFILQSQ